MICFKIENVDEEPDSFKISKKYLETPNDHNDF